MRKFCVLLIAAMILSIGLVSLAEAKRGFGGGRSFGRSSFKSSSFKSKSYSKPKSYYKPKAKSYSKPKVVKKTTVVQKNTTVVNQAAPSSGGSAMGGFMSNVAGTMAGMGLYNMFFGDDGEQPQYAPEMMQAPEVQNQEATQNPNP